MSDEITIDSLALEAHVEVYDGALGKTVMAPQDLRVFLTQRPSDQDPIVAICKGDDHVFELTPNEAAGLVAACASVLGKGATK